MVPVIMYFCKLSLQTFLKTEPSNELMYDEGDDNSHKSADQQKDRFLIVSLALFSCLFNAVEFLAVIECDNLFIGINVIVFLRLFDFQCIEQRSAYDDPPDQRADCSQILHQGHSRQDAQQDKYGKDPVILFESINNALINFFIFFILSKVLFVWKKADLNCTCFPMIIIIRVVL